VLRTEYVLNLYETSISACWITKTRLVDYTEGIELRNVRGHLAVVPLNIALHAEYVFKYEISTEPTGTVVYTTNEKKLVVGCTNGTNINLPSFTTELNANVG
jgi:hypothetical protein